MNISNFLKKFKDLDLDRKNKKGIILNCFNSVTNLNIEEKDFSISTDKIILKTSSAYKFEISMRKKEILSCIGKALGKNLFKEIK